jgi:hypothetical protein
LLPISCVLLLAASAWFRVCDLENLPGINGDEAWYGVQAYQIGSGKAFEWRTTSGLPLNPFFSGPQVLLLLVLRPSFWMLRVPAVISGILTVALVFWLGARVLDRTTAAMAALLTAVLPSLIGYSRLGWYVHQTPLFSMPALYFAFRGKTLAMLVAFGLCVFVHASNVFLFPVLLGPFLAVLWKQEESTARRRLILGATAACALLLLVGLVWLDGHDGRLGLASRSLPENWLRFLGLYGRLVSGASLYEFVVGPLSPETQAGYDGVFWGLFLPLLVFGVPRLCRERHWERLALIGGLAVGALGLYLVGGPEVIRPHRERYGMYLVLPTTLAAACLLSAVLPGRGDGRAGITRPALLAALFAAACIPLYSFKVHYLDALRRTGGESHLTFRTAQIEPKQQALRMILDDVLSRTGTICQRRGGARALGGNDQVAAGSRSVEPVIAEDFWLYWPLRFLACGRAEIEIVPFEEDETFALLAKEAKRAPALEILASGGYAVAFAGGALERRVTSAFPPGRLERRDVLDYGGRKLISVFRVEAR